MMEENKVRIVEMIKMRIDGFTYQEIADKYGCSRQCVYNTIMNFIKTEGRIGSRVLDKCIYPNLRIWILENKIQLRDLSKICGLSEKGTTSISGKLSGKYDFRIPEIKAILEKSGESFEYMFCTESEKEESQED